MNTLNEHQITAEVRQAQKDIEARLNSLEARVGRVVLSCELHLLDITRVENERREFIRYVRIRVAEPIGLIGG